MMAVGVELFLGARSVSLVCFWFLKVSCWDWTLNVYNILFWVVGDHELIGKLVISGLSIVWVF